MFRGRVTLFVLLSVLVAGCGSDGLGVNSESPQPGAPVTADALDGRSFLSTAVRGHDLVAGSRVRLAFEGATLRVSANCNSMGGPFEIDEQTLVVSEMGGTVMGCEPNLMAQDEWLRTFLTSGPIVELDDGTLTLAASTVIVTFVDETVADPARRLVGTMWTLDGIIDTQAVSSVPTDVEPPTLEIGDDGQAAVFTGCNRGGATAETDRSTLSFGPMRMTKMACPGPTKGVEAAVVAVLSGDTTFVIDGPQLTITKGDQGLMYRAP